MQVHVAVDLSFVYERVSRECGIFELDVEWCDHFSSACLPISVGGDVLEAMAFAFWFCFYFATAVV